jgi:hypothetical protein
LLLGKDQLFSMSKAGISCDNYIRISSYQLLLIGQDQLLPCAGQGSAVTVKYSGPAISCCSMTRIGCCHVQGRDQLLQLNIQVQQLPVAHWPGSAIIMCRAGISCFQLNIQVQQLAVAQWPGSADTQWSGSAVAQWPGSAVAQWPGSAVAQRPGSAVAQWPGSLLLNS